MQAQQRVRISAAPATATLALLAALALGGAGGYVLGSAPRPLAAIPSVNLPGPQVMEIAPLIDGTVNASIPAMAPRYAADEGEYCFFGEYVACLKP